MASQIAEAGQCCALCKNQIVYNSELMIITSSVGNVDTRGRSRSTCWEESVSVSVITIKKGATITII